MEHYSHHFILVCLTCYDHDNEDMTVYSLSKLENFRAPSVERARYSLLVFTDIAAHQDFSCLISHFTSTSSLFTSTSSLFTRQKKAHEYCSAGRRKEASWAFCVAFWFTSLFKSARQQTFCICIYNTTTNSYHQQVKLNTLEVINVEFKLSISLLEKRDFNNNDL